ncbi:tubulin-specific chaperone E-like isoform X1 [Mya arenaria]|uniref:tubulin-specific chaperone E-like isoform X1 n=3 Tax=Mya arenaria TaxID=6604 RepID=UPI0022E7212B|nr:tubulin-specific chaperone E-like isoform X1 [Mya arenaria]
MYKNFVSKSKMTEGLHTVDGVPVGIGDRLECDGCLATIRFIGEVPPTKGVWLGVEWDDPERGKHNGTHEGHTFFTTRHPKSGSFIRPKKANFGVSFMSAVCDRYGRIEDENAGVITDDLYVVGGKNQQTVVEMVGARKVNDLQGKLDELKEVALRGMLVYGTLASDDISVLVPSIVDLDISQNLLSSWQQISEITKQLRKLKSLNVSGNVLEIPDRPGDLLENFSHITAVFLNRMGYDWAEVLKCSEMFPRLEQLHVCFNGISTLSVLNGHLQNVQLVNLESNTLQDWEQLLYLGHLPHLHTLIVSDNKIPRVFFDSNGSFSTELFPKLRCLTINNNLVNEWESINELNKLASLEDLRIKSNPLMESATEQTVRQLLIAKLKHLKMCNRTEVANDERKGAEIDYLKRFGPEWVKSGGHQDLNVSKPSQEFVKQHPRYADLVSIWGAPEDSEMKQQSETLKSSLIGVKIICPDLADSKVLEKKLPLTMTVGKLKALIFRVFKIDSDIKLFYKSLKNADQNLEYELDNDQSFLSFFAIEQGDTIIVKL